MFSNWQYRLLALILALSCWYIVTGREKVQTWVEMPVEIVNAPEGLILTQGARNKISVLLRGPKALMRALGEKRPAYTLDLSTLEPGETELVFDAKNMPLSMAIEVVEIDPPRMTLVADRLVTRSVPVTPKWEGGPGRDYEMVNATSTPDSVTIEGAKSLVDAVKEVPTRLLSVNATGSGEQKVLAPLALPESVTSDLAEVQVRLVWEVKHKRVWIKLPVKVMRAGGENGTGAKVRPASLQIQAQVPVTLLREKDFKSGFMAYVILPSTLKPGSHVLPVRIKMPVGCVLEKTVPESVSVRIK